MPEMIFFDAAGTLLYLPRGVGEHYREVALRHGLDRAAPELEAAFRAAWKEAPAPVETHRPREDDDRGWWQSLVYAVLVRCKAALDFPRDAFFAELFAEFTKPGVWSLFDEVPEVLKALQGQYRLGIISNFDGRLRAILGHLGLAETFEVVAISSELGADKPDPWLFREAARLAGVAPEECLHVGDDPECDWAAARGAGMQAFELDRPRVTLRDVIRNLR